MTGSDRASNPEGGRMEARRLLPSSVPAGRGGEGRDRARRGSVLNQGIPALFPERRLPWGAGGSLVINRLWEKGGLKAREGMLSLSEEFCSYSDTNHSSPESFY